MNPLTMLGPTTEARVHVPAAGLRQAIAGSLLGALDGLPLGIGDAITVRIEGAEVVITGPEGVVAMLEEGARRGIASVVLGSGGEA